MITSKRLEPLTLNGNIVVKAVLTFVTWLHQVDLVLDMNFIELAGNDEAVLLRTDTGRKGDIYDGPYYINNRGLYLSGRPNQPDSMELKPTRMNYEVGADI